jgi:hypothetical protein
VAAEEARAVVVVERLLSLQLEAVEMRVANAVARRRTAAAETAQMVRVRAKMAFPSERLPGPAWERRDGRAASRRTAL